MDLTLVFLIKWISIVAAIGVVNVNNPVHAILLLITVFVGAGMLLLILQAEFLALLYIVVYVGAIAVLFLFVIMCLNVKIVYITQTALNYMASSIITMVLFTLLLAKAFTNYGNQHLDASIVPYINWVQFIDSFSNIEAIGQTLFLFQPLSFILVGLILFTSMLGSIILTLSHSIGVRRQVIWLQNQGNFQTSVRIVK